MARTRFPLILFFRMVAHKAACHTLYPVKCFFEIYEDMVQILLILKVLFKQNSEVEVLFCLKICSVVLLPALNPTCSSAIISSARGLSLFKITLSMTILGINFYLSYISQS